MTQQNYICMPAHLHAETLLTSVVPVLFMPCKALLSSEQCQQAHISKLWAMYVWSLLTAETEVVPRALAPFMPELLSSFPWGIEEVRWGG